MSFQEAPRHFHIVGYPVTSSKSPLLHSAGFAHYGLPHTYTLRNTPTLDPGTIALLRDPAFGGASVTMPHKATIREYLDAESPVAELLGAVNTIIPRANPATGTVELVGDNTDWVGISRLLKQELKPRHGLDEHSTGLVIGAGGAARAAVYALHDLGLQTIYLYNRTRATAEAVQASFPASYNIVLISSLAHSSFSASPPIVIIGTVPAQATSLSPNPSTLLLSPDCLSRPLGGVLVDMAYLPRRTPLVKLAEGREEWTTQTGIMVLLAQGFAQFEIWNGVKAPEEEMRSAVLCAYDAENPE